jgi:hypothetical protein
MKRFLISVLCVSVFFLGLGTLIEKVGARFKSDEKALSLIKAAKAAIGGDGAISGIQSLRIKGATTHTFKIDGTDRSETGETEIALQLPDKVSKMIKMGHEDGNAPAGPGMMERRSEVVLVTKDKDGNDMVNTTDDNGSGVRKIIVKKGDGADVVTTTDDKGPGVRTIVVKKGDGTEPELKTEEGNRIFLSKVDSDQPMKIEGGQQMRFRVNGEEIEAHHKQAQQNELFRLTLGLLLSPPANLAVNYTFGGETTVDSTPCNLVVAEVGGSSVKLYLDRSSNLPVMMSYTGEQMPMILHFNKGVPAPPNGDKNVVFFRKADGPEATTEFQVRFSDYRSTGGLQLPYKWTTTSGNMNEVLDVSSYDVNPANIGDSFQQPKVLLRTKKDGN